MLELFPSSSAVDGAELFLGGIPASELAERFGTPLVVYCEQTLRERARALRAAVEGGRIVFGTKAFPNLAVLQLLREEGLGADVASSGELAFALAAGLTGDEIVVHGNNKDERFLGEAGSEGATVVLDAPDEAALAAAAGVARVLVRVTLGVDADTHEAIRTDITARSSGSRPTRRASSSPMRSIAGSRCWGCTSTSARSLPTSTRRQRRSCALRPSRPLPRPTRLDAAGDRPRRWFRHSSHPEDHVTDAAELGLCGSDGPYRVRRGRAAQGRLWLEPGRSIVGQAGVTLYRVGASNGWSTAPGSRSTGACPTTPGPSSTTPATRRSAPRVHTSRTP